MACLTPPLDEAPDGNWSCDWCLHPEKYAATIKQKKRRKHVIKDLSLLKTRRPKKWAGDEETKKT